MDSISNNLSSCAVQQPQPDQNTDGSASTNNNGGATSSQSTSQGSVTTQTTTPSSGMPSLQKTAPATPALSNTQIKSQGPSQAHLNKIFNYQNPPKGKSTALAHKRISNPKAKPTSRALKEPGKQANAGGQTHSANPLAKECKPYEGMIDQASKQYGVPAWMIEGIISHESHGVANAQNPYSSAKGPMQLLGPTARALGVKNALNPAQNIAGGAKLLRYLLGRFNGNTTMALAAYSDGEGAVMNRGASAQARGLIHYVQKFA